MTLRLAGRADLIGLKEMYQKIICSMNENGIDIWDDVYPCEFFADDIDSSRLYVLTSESGSMLGAFALCESNAGEGYVEWGDKAAKALYIDRLGVRADCSGQGIGSALLDGAAEAAREKGAEYVRLFVVDRNRPAISLYEKKAFARVPGIFVEVIDSELSLQEYGFEKKI